MKKLKVLLCGAFGYGNLGDNLLRDEAIKFFNNYFPSIEIYIDRPYPNQELIDYVDLRIIGPGGLLYDSNKTHTEYFKSYCKKPFICLGVGIQFYDELKRDGLVSHCGKNADLMVVRHLQDKAYLSALNTNVYYMSDFGYFYNNNTSANHIIKKDKKIVTICANSKFKYKFEKECLQQTDIFLSVSKEDNDYMDKLSKSVNNERTTNDFYFDSYSNIYEILQNTDLLITSRYHAGILASTNKKTKIVCLEKNYNQWYKFECEFKNKFNQASFLENPDSYIDSIDNENNHTKESLQIEKEKIVKILKDYFESNF